MWDSKKKVQEQATKALKKLCSAIDSKDVEPFIQMLQLPSFKQSQLQLFPSQFLYWKEVSRRERLLPSVQKVGANLKNSKFEQVKDFAAKVVQNLSVRTDSDDEDWKVDMLPLLKAFLWYRR